MASAGWHASMGLVAATFMAGASVLSTTRKDDETSQSTSPWSPSTGLPLHPKHSNWGPVYQRKELQERRHRCTLSDIWDTPSTPALGLTTSPKTSPPTGIPRTASSLASGSLSSVAGSATGNLAPRARHEISISHHQAPAREVVDTKPRLDQQQLQSEEERLQKRIATLKEIEQKIKDSIVELNIEGIQLSQTKKEAEEQLGPIQENLSRVFEQLEGAQAELLSKGADLATLEATLATKQEEAANVQKQAAELQQTLSRTQEELTDARHLCDDAQRDLADLQMSKQSATAALEKERQDLKLAEEALGRQKGSVSDAQTELATLRQELASLSSEVNTAKTGRARKDDKIKTALEQEKSAKAALATLEAQIKDRERERDDQATRHAAELKMAQDELTATKLNLDGVRAEFEKAREQVQKATKAIAKGGDKQKDAEARAAQAESDSARRVSDAERRTREAEDVAAQAETKATEVDKRARKAEEDLQGLAHSREQAALAFQQLEAKLKSEAESSKRIADAEQRAAQDAAARAEVTAKDAEDRARTAENDLRRLAHSYGQATLSLQHLRASLKSATVIEAVPTSLLDNAATTSISATPVDDNSEQGYDVETPSKTSDSAYETASTSSQSTTGKWPTVVPPEFNSSQFIPPRRQGSTSGGSQPQPIPAPPSSASAHLKPSVGTKPLVAEQTGANFIGKPLSPPESPVVGRTSLPGKHALSDHASMAKAASASTAQDAARLQPLDTTVVSPPQITQEPTPPMTARPSAPGIITPAPSTSSEGNATSEAKDKAAATNATVPEALEASSSSNLASSVQAPPDISDVPKKPAQLNRSDSVTASSAVQQGISSTMDANAPSFALPVSEHVSPTTAQQSALPNLDAGAADFVPRGKGAVESSLALAHGGPPGISSPPALKTGKKLSPDHRSDEPSSPQSPTNAKGAPTHRLITSSAPLKPTLNSESRTGLPHMNQLDLPQSPQSPKNSKTSSTKKSNPAPSLAMPKEKDTKRGFGNWAPAALRNMATRAINTAADILGPTIAEDEGPGLPTTTPVRNSSDSSRTSPHNAVRRSPELAPSSNVHSPSTRMTAPQAPSPDGAELQRTTGIASESSKLPASRRKRDTDTAISMVSASPLTSEVAPQEQHVVTKEQVLDVQVEVADLVDTTDNLTPQSAPQESTAKVIVAPSIPITVSSSHMKTEFGLSIDVSSPPPADENPVKPILPVESLPKASTKEDSQLAAPAGPTEPTTTPLSTSPATEQPQQKGQEPPHVQQPLPSVPAQCDVKPDEQLPAKDELPLVPLASRSVEAAAVHTAETTPADTAPTDTAPTEITPESTSAPATTSVFSKRIDDLVIQVKPGASPFPVAIFEIIFPTEYTIPTFDDEGSGSEEGDVSGAVRTPMPKPHRELSELS